MGKSTLKINPDNDAMSQSKIPVVSVLSANFKPSESSYKLIFTARVASNIMDTISENNNKGNWSFNMRFFISYFVKFQ